MLALCMLLLGVLLCRWWSLRLLLRMLVWQKEHLWTRPFLSDVVLDSFIPSEQNVDSTTRDPFAGIESISWNTVPSTY